MHTDTKENGGGVDIGRLIMIYAVEITPGKFEVFEDLSDVNLNKEYR